jgi:hypothetical protein
MVNIEPKLIPKGTQAAATKTAVQRQPRGTKVGGRFAPEVTSEAEVELLEESVPLSDGSKAFEERSKKTRDAVTEPVVAPEPVVEAPRTTSDPIKLGGAVEYEESWQYPPAPSRDIEKMAAYWSNVLIPDGALQNIENADRDRDFFAYEEEYANWVNAKPTPTTHYRKKHPEEYAKFAEESQARKAVVDKVQFHQGLIPRTELRDVARLGAFWIQASAVDDETRAKAASTEFVTSTGEVVSALDIVQKYRLREIEGAFFNRVRYSRPV